MKKYFISKIDNNLNELYRQKLSLRLNRELNIYKNDEIFFIARDIENVDSDNIGICRLVVNLEKNLDKLHINCLNKNIQKDKNNFYLSGVWVEDKDRNIGIGKTLINYRLKLIKKGDFIFTDARVNSSLNQKYLDIGLKEIGKTDTHIYLYGEYNGNLI